MVKNSDKDQIEVQTLEEFKKVDTDLLEERYSRYLWTVKEWKRIIGRKINRPPHIDTLYIEGSCAFFYGYYTASILTITAAIELTLKAIVDLSLMPSKTSKNVQNVINEAIKQNIISQELGNDLHYLRKNTRNVLTHDQKMAKQMTAGMEKDPTDETSYLLDDNRLQKLSVLQRESKESLFVSREVYAREAIQLLFRVFHGCLTSGRDWSNLL